MNKARQVMEDSLADFYNQDKTKYSSDFQMQFVDEFILKCKNELVDIEEVRSVKHLFIERIVTKEGLKKNGKYKNWLNNLRERFGKSLKEVYGVPLYEMPGGIGFRDLALEAWCEFKMPGNLKFLANAYKRMNPVNLQYQQEVYNSDWAKTGVDVPQWFKDKFQNPDGTYV